MSHRTTLSATACHGIPSIINIHWRDILPSPAEPMYYYFFLVREEEEDLFLDVICSLSARKKSSLEENPKARVWCVMWRGNVFFHIFLYVVCTLQHTYIICCDHDFATSQKRSSTKIHGAFDKRGLREKTHGVGGRNCEKTRKDLCHSHVVPSLHMCVTPNLAFCDAF